MLLADGRGIGSSTGLGGPRMVPPGHYVGQCGESEWWQAGDREGAASLVTDEMVLATTLIGTEPMVRQRLQAWHRAGVTTVRLYPSGAILEARLATLAKAIDIARETGQSP